MIIACANCGKEVSKYPAEIKRGSKYCSLSCSGKSTGFKKGSGFWTGKKRENLKETGAVRTMFKKGLVPWNKGIDTRVGLKCIGCGETFKVKPNDYKRKNIKYCSKECRSTTAPFRRAKKKCPTCGELIQSVSYKCKSCVNIGVERLYSRGENSHLWKGGITPINKLLRKSSAYTVWRTSVFRRDNFTCQMCGKRGVELHADHIKPFAYFPELRFEISNGRTLCVNCHKETDTYMAKGRWLYEK